MNRRDILKLFGVGGVVVPIVGGMPVEEARSLIVSPPKIEVPKVREIAPAFPPFPDFNSVYDTMIYCRPRAGEVFRIHCETFVTEYDRDPPTRYSTADFYGAHFIPGIPCTMKFVVTGKVSFGDWE